MWGKPIYLWQPRRKLPNPVAAPTPLSLTYTGSPQTLHTAGSVPSGTLQYKLDGTNMWSYNPVDATNVGMYTVYWRVKDNSWDDSTYEAPVPISGSISVTIAEAPVLYSIEITTYPDRVNYSAGESFDPTGMVIEATYTNGTTKTVLANDSGLSFNPSGPMLPIITQVQVTYTDNGVSADAWVYVSVT